jgi:hypothetical protein
MAYLSPVDKRLATDISFIEPHVNGVEKNGHRMPVLQNDLQIIEFEELIADGYRLTRHRRQSSRLSTDFLKSVRIGAGAVIF